MYRAWSPAFYKSIQAEFPEYANIPYIKAFYDWRNSFKAEWPSLLIEPESEQIKTDEIRMKALISVVQVLAPQVDPDNKGRVFQWFQDNLNSNTVLFKTELDLDIDALVEYEPPQLEAGGASEGPSSQSGTAQKGPIDQLTRSDSVDWEMPAKVVAQEKLGYVRPGIKRRLK
jgi:hypothetical protein